MAAAIEPPGQGASEWERALTALSLLRSDMVGVLLPSGPNRWCLSGRQGAEPDMRDLVVEGAQAARDRRAPVRVDAAEEPDATLRRRLQLRGARHLLFVPATDGPLLRAVFLLGRRARDWSAAEAEAASAVADLAATALAARELRGSISPLPAWVTALLDALPDPVWLCRPDGSVSCANAAATAFLLRMGGSCPQEGQPLPALLGADRPLPPAEAAVEVRGLGPACEFHLLCHIRPLQPPGGTPQLLVFGRDLTEEYRHREDRLRQERLAALGQIAAGAAHEIRNPLTAVRGFLQLVSSQVSGEPQAHYLRIVRQEIERIERITADLLVLARSWKITLSACSVGPLLESVVQLVLPRARERGIHVQLEAERGQAVVFADPERLEQVFLNLLGNALEAVPPGGHVTVRAHPLPDGGVEIGVRDDGPGIPREILPRIFEPFFTTKAGGTGLGLAVSESIVRSFGGQITVASPPGRGATFTIRLPALHAQPGSTEG